MSDKLPVILPFGKYKGQPIEVLKQDESYANWLSNQDWFREKYLKHHTIIINNFQEPSETPAHNSLQVLFLDEDFCYKFFKTMYPTIEDNYIEDLIQSPLFEYKGIDVLLAHLWNGTPDGIYCAVEIKPQVGDDYPAVLRQMKSNGSNILFLESYTGQGATLAQFIKTFELSDIKVIFKHEVDRVKLED